ncbi:MAG: hypothetical protein IJ851_05890 [Eubacterium sp.]|nr:hypothetical protein [Eubacterium sp.]
MKKDLVKRVLAVIMTVVIVMAFASCKAKKGGPETIEVTDTSGQVVTDTNGNPVTESVEISDVSETSQQGGSQQGSGSNSDSGGGSESGEDDKKETTTEKPTEAKKRDVKVTIKLPYKNDEDSVLTVSYRTNGETQYTTLDPQNVKLTGDDMEVEIGNYKGPVIVRISLTGVDIAPGTDVVTIGSAYDNARIEPAIGIEIADGGWD